MMRIEGRKAQKSNNGIHAQTWRAWSLPAALQGTPKTPSSSIFLFICEKGEPPQILSSLDLCFQIPTEG